MQKKIPFKALILTSILLFIGTEGAFTVLAAGSQVTKYVFRIRRNKNRNLVQYAIRLTPEKCELKGDEPVYVFWRDLEEGPTVTSSIKFYEKLAYGIDSQKVISKNKMEIRLNALSERLITIESSGSAGKCSVASRTAINGKISLFDEVYVFAEEGFIKPTVKWIEVVGKTAAGVRVKQRIIKD